jgi:rare lipoprotein A
MPLDHLSNRGVHAAVACSLVLWLGAAFASSAADSRRDVSGQTREGVASFYARSFAGRLMADGTKMNPGSDNAASRTLPLGTRALVTNLSTGLAAVVTIRDRGPYVRGRIVDLSPATARQIGLTTRQGLARVEVVPLVVPQPGGGKRT